MFQKCSGKFLGLYQSIAGKNIVRTNFMQRAGSKSGLLCICFVAALFFAFTSNYSARAHTLAATSIRTENRAIMQSDSPISPLALGVQDAADASADKSSQEGSAAVAGVFHEANEDLFPISSGKQANQTSLVLIGAVLVALTMVVGLAIGRKET